MSCTEKKGTACCRSPLLMALMLRGFRKRDARLVARGPRLERRRNERIAIAAIVLGGCDRPIAIEVHDAGAASAGARAQFRRVAPHPGQGNEYPRNLRLHTLIQQLVPGSAARQTCEDPVDVLPGH